MTNLTNKITSGLSTIVLAILGAVMVGLGFAFLGMLTLFALIGVGVALLAAPFVKMAPSEDMEAETASA